MKLLLITISMLLAAIQDDKPWRLIYESGGKMHSVREDDLETRIVEAEKPANYVLSPDGQRRAYVSRTEDSSYLSVSDSEGKNAKALTPDSIELSCASPQWAADSRRIVFAHTKGEQWQIWIINEDGSHLAKLTDHPAGAKDPRVSPGGDRVCYRELHRQEGKLPPSTLRIMDLAGRDSKVLIEKTQMLGHAWSPKGDRIACSLVQELRILEMPSGKTAKSIKFEDVRKELYAHAAYGMLWRPDGGAIACNIQFLGGRMEGAKDFGDERLFILPMEGKPVVIEAGGPAAPLRWTR